MRIVVADDKGPALRFLRRVCRQAGHEVIGEAWNGQQAVDFCAELKPDIVILDNDMPVMKGIEAARIIKRDGTANHIIAFTTLTQRVNTKPFEDLGCIVTPKSDEEAFLLRAIEKCQK